MKRIMTLTCLILFAYIGSSQDNSDSYNYNSDERENTLFNGGGIRLSGIWGGTTNGFVKFQNDFSLNNAGFFVFEINEDFLIGWSGYGSGTELENGSNASIDGHNLLLGYTVNSDQAIHPVIYAKGGSGILEIDETSRDRVSILEPSIGVELNVFRFMRIGVDAGYRFISGVDTAGYTDNDFSSAFIGLRFKFGYSW